MKNIAKLSQLYKILNEINYVTLSCKCIESVLNKEFRGRST